MSSLVEIEVNRHLTKLFVEDDPSFIALTPHHREKAASGGFREVSGPPKATQMVKLIFQETKGSPDETADGAIHKQTVVIVGLYNADIAAGDTFIWPPNSDDHWVISGIHPYNGYELKADAIAYGPKGDHSGNAARGSHGKG